MAKLTLNNRDIGKGNLILVNKTYPLDTSIEEKPLLVACSNSPKVLLEATAATMLSRLLHTLDCKDKILPISGYRTLQEQESLFYNSINENGREFTLKYVALPNCSEHQTGLAIDLAENKPGIDFIRPDFSYTGICQNFREKASKYGFIQRYQLEKESITGIAHEPWHFRYVGYSHSEVMKNNSLSLEEYIDFLKTFSFDGKHLFIEMDKRNIEIFYVNAASSLPVVLELQDNIPRQVSGNNVDGFIITLWKNPA
jgi:D-alanyl-D-alanine dipeptidase/carboxypeptidase